MEFPDWLKAQRIARELSIKQASTKMDISARQLLNLESGNSVPVVSTVGAIAEAYGLDDMVVFNKALAFDESRRAKRGK
jgi:transcriptional regulator with XRE-family HTH domain